jgi:transcriptional regulator with XRE-family HTH domain
VTLGERIVAWRLARRAAPDDVASRSGVDPTRLDAIEQGDTDATGAEIEAVASALGVPPGWMFDDPKRLLALIETDGEDPTEADPVTARMLAAAGTERALFTLLTQLVWSGEPRLVRAAEVSLRSLVKQIPRTMVPWESRPSGHFEPPAD